MNKIHANKNYYLIFTLCFLVFGLIVALLTSVINYKSNLTDIDKQLQQMASSEVEFRRDLLFKYISRFEMLISSITSNDLTTTYIKSKDVNNKKNLNDLFFALSYANKDIMQLRYIDEFGQEVIRVDRFKNTAALQVIPASKLQNKGERYYFKETSRLMANQFWHSNIDLNIEQGKIEQPIKPTFRIATPLVFESTFKGIVIANLMFDGTINALTTSPNFDIYLADGDGEIIHNPDHSKSWSRYLENKKNLYDIFPAHVNKIISNDSLDRIGVHSYALGDLFKNGENIKIIFTPKSGVIEDMRDKNIQAVIIVALTVLVVSFPLSWLISIIPSKLQTRLSAAYTEIKKNADIIDKHVIMSTTDKNGIVKSISTCFTKTTGYTADEVIGAKHNVLRHPDTPIETYKDMWKTLLSGKNWEGDIKDRNKFGVDFWLHLIITVEFTKDGEIGGFTAVAQNITNKKNIEQMSITDCLTGLYNRHKLEDTLSSEVARFNRYKTDFSVIIFDIDFFKKVNDTFGHQAGDDVLIQLANIFKENARENDCVSRWGGEEFLIIAGGVDLAGAFLFAEKLRSVVENFNFPTVGKTTISCGVAQYSGKETYTDLISRADKALYEAKNSGKNRVIKG